jgi:acetamidase/formamidase
VLRLNILKGKHIGFPRAMSRQCSRNLFVSMGISTDLYEASKFAIEEMVDELAGRGFAGAEAYMLCSLVGDLRIAELVDEPNHVVSMTIPVDVLTR